MMKAKSKIFFKLIILLSLVTIPASGMESFESKMKELNSSPMILAKRSKKKLRTRRKKRISRPILVDALRLAKRGKYEEASIKLFQLSQSPRFADKRNQIKYILGLMLYQMKLNQISTFQFISVIKKGQSKYLRQSLEKLSLAADFLGDDTLFNYALSKVKVKSFPRVHRDMLYYRIGEFLVRNKQYSEAAKSFTRVKKMSPYYSKAKYNQALAYAELRKVASAVRAFEQLVDYRSDKPITDGPRVAALIGKARALYQGKKFDEAIEIYRQVPRDTSLWHETLFESSWAMLRSGRFRTALSNFQSLHSPYYQTSYLPESLLLRSIVYLYICKYDEMEKVLNLYESIYKPVYRRVKSFIKRERNPVVYYKQVAKVIRAYKKEGDSIDDSKFLIPFIVARKIYKEGDFQSNFNYIRKLLEERRRIKKMSPRWRRSAIGRYAKKVINTRIRKARKTAGRIVKKHMLTIQGELFELTEQQGFIRFEMLKGKKDALKKKIAGKDISDVHIEEEKDRSFYVQNGYEYWPFKGEYWLDELGNYHYLGTQSCN